MGASNIFNMKLFLVLMVFGVKRVSFHSTHQPLQQSVFDLYLNTK